MPAINRGDVWMVDFGMAAKVRPALLLTGEPADDELDLVTLLLHTTAVRGNRWKLAIPKPPAAKLERSLGTLTPSEMVKSIREAGHTPIQRNTFSEPIKVWDATPTAAEPEPPSGKSKVLEDHPETA